jgi:hypothetical protein
MGSIKLQQPGFFSILASGSHAGSMESRYAIGQREIFRASISLSLRCPVTYDLPKSCGHSHPYNLDATISYKGGKIDRLPAL